MAAPPTPPHCPSAQPDWRGAVGFAVVGGTASAPRATYLAEPVAVTPQLLAAAEPVTPTEVFRFAAPCMANGCQHFAAGRCGLVTRIAAGVPEVSAEPPECAIREVCRWWLQEGVSACRRCPQVVTDDAIPSSEMRVAAAPPVRGER